MYSFGFFPHGHLHFIQIEIVLGTKTEESSFSVPVFVCTTSTLTTQFFIVFEADNDGNIGNAGTGQSADSN